MAARRAIVAFVLLSLLASVPAVAVEETTVVLTRRAVSLWVAAVGQRADGSLFGVASALTLSAQAPGRGDVFVRVEPLAEVDMQGAARLAVDAAGEFTGRPTRDWDWFFTITTGSPIIGGPSAGGAMAVAAAAVLMNWTLDPDVAMTGMINPDLSIGPVGGILYKAEAVAEVHVRTFLIPAGERLQYRVVERQNPDGTVTGTREAVDVAAHARQAWGLNVVEVQDLYEATPYFTGLRVAPPSTQVDPTQNAAYQSLMADVSRAQLANATAQHQTAAGKYEAARGQLPAGTRTAIEDALGASAQALERARNASGAQRHYQASSYAFQSLVQSRHAHAALDFYAQNQAAATYVRAYAESVRAELEAAQSATRKRYPLTASELGAQGARDLRFSEAARLVDQAVASADAGQFDAALQAASFARERADSGRWWSLIRDRMTPLGPTANVTEKRVSALALEYGSSATLMFSYAQRVLQQAGGGDARLVAAQRELESAQAAGRTGAVAGQVYGLLRAMSQVNAAMAGLTPPEALAQRLGTVRERAAFDIQVARAAGVEPVFAVSQFEFAEGLSATATADAYEAYTLARMSARATLVAAGHEAPVPDVAPFVPSFSAPLDRVLAGAAWGLAVWVGLPGAVAWLLAGIVGAPRREK